MKVGIINFKMGNLNSVKNAIEYLGCKVEIIENQNQFEDEISHIILPGVGSFRDAMNNLNSMSIIDKLREEVFLRKKNFGHMFGYAIIGFI